jgi:protein arginine N-methyltransferase 3
MDLATMTADQQDFTATFQLTAAASISSSSRSSSGDSSSVTVAALVLWFDVEFSERFCKDHPVTLSTSPSAEVTHWAHAVLPLQEPIKLAAAAADSRSSSSGGGLPCSVECRLSMARSKSKHRSLDISLEVGGQARVYTMEVTGSE